jgi:hypothetical protein
MDYFPRAACGFVDQQKDYFHDVQDEVALRQELEMNRSLVVVQELGCQMALVQESVSQLDLASVLEVAQEFQ